MKKWSLSVLANYRKINYSLHKHLKIVSYNESDSYANGLVMIGISNIIQSLLKGDFNHRSAFDFIETLSLVLNILDKAISAEFNTCTLQISTITKVPFNSSIRNFKQNLTSIFYYLPKSILIIDLKLLEILWKLSKEKLLNQHNICVK